MARNYRGRKLEEELKLAAHHVPFSFGPATCQMFCHWNLVYGTFKSGLQSLYPSWQNSNKITISVRHILYISTEVARRLDLFLLNCPSVYSVHVYKNTRTLKLEQAAGAEEEEEEEEEDE